MNTQANKGTIVSKSVMLWESDTLDHEQGESWDLLIGQVKPFVQPTEGIAVSKENHLQPRAPSVKWYFARDRNYSILSP